MARIDYVEVYVDFEVFGQAMAAGKMAHTEQNAAIYKVFLSGDALRGQLGVNDWRIFLADVDGTFEARAYAYVEGGPGVEEVSEPDLDWKVALAISTVEMFLETYPDPLTKGSAGWFFLEVVRGVQISVAAVDVELESVVWEAYEYWQRTGIFVRMALISQEWARRQAVEEYFERVAETFGGRVDVDPPIFWLPEWMVRLNKLRAEEKRRLVVEMASRWGKGGLEEAPF